MTGDGIDGTRSGSAALTADPAPDLVVMADPPGSAGEEEAVASSPLPALLFDLRDFSVLAVSDSFADLVGEPREAITGRVLWDFLPDGPSGISALLASGRVEAAELGHLLATARGVVHTKMWVRAVEGPTPPTRAITVVCQDADGSDVPILRISGDAHRLSVVGTVDAEWRIDRISLDVQALLGRSPEEMVGTSILTAVAGEDTSVLLLTVARAVADQAGALTRVRMMGPSGSIPTMCDLLVTPLQAPPQFAFVISQPDAQHLGARPRPVHRIAQGVRDADTSVQLARLPDAGRAPRLAQLSTRELEVVTRLARGRRVPAIAAELFLSQGTVRNHLSSVFQKVGVHSQQELLDLIHSATAPGGSAGAGRGAGGTA